jgi:hypothetical protein
VIPIFFYILILESIYLSDLFVSLKYSLSYLWMVVLTYDEEAADLSIESIFIFMFYYLSTIGKRTPAYLANISHFSYLY